MKDIDPNVHIKAFKKTNIANGEIVETNIINLFGFILQDNISKWSKNFIQDHPYYTFDELEQTFWTMKNDEKVYMQLRNLQQQVGKWVKVYYECLLKLANCLQVKATDVFLTTIFKTHLQPYFRLATTCMMRYTLIKHKEITMICEENGLVITKCFENLTKIQTTCIAHSHHH